MSNYITNQNSTTIKPSFLENYLYKPLTHLHQPCSTYLLSFRVLAITFITLLITFPFISNLNQSPIFLILTPLIYMLFSTLNPNLIVSSYPLSIIHHQPNHHSTTPSIVAHRPLCIKI